MRTRIKFCGITTPEDAVTAARFGADAIGFVFYPSASAAIDAASAANASRVLPPFVATVALFVDADTSTVNEVIETVSPDYLQFHGGEDAAYCRQFGVPYIKACRVRSVDDIATVQAAHPDSRGILLDAHVEGVPGGTGKSFDWSCIPSSNANQPFIVAGGLTAGNVGDLIRRVHPWGVDVSGGIAVDGNRQRKDWDKMAAFSQAVRDAN